VNLVSVLTGHHGRDQPNSRLETFCDGVRHHSLLVIDIKIPASDAIGTTSELWLALRHLVPSVLAFVLSFVIILITWVNHHAAFRLVNRRVCRSGGWLDSSIWSGSERWIDQR
jgi:uncharacterized membrane protein